MPSRDLVVQNQQLQREVDRLKAELTYTRNWQVLGVADRVTVEFGGEPLTMSRGQFRLFEAMKDRDAPPCSLNLR